MPNPLARLICWARGHRRYNQPWLDCFCERCGKWLGFPDDVRRGKRMEGEK